MKFLIDTQLPIALAKYLRSRGHDCQHVLDLGLDEADDMAVWVYASREGSVVISKDDDFVFLANRPGDVGRLVWVRLGNCRNASLIEAFQHVHDDIIQALEAGQRVIEIR